MTFTSSRSDMRSETKNKISGLLYYILSRRSSFFSTPPPPPPQMEDLLKRIGSLLSKFNKNGLLAIDLRDHPFTHGNLLSSQLGEVI